VLLESRLDNLLFRSGFLPTVPAARQLINHGHVRVNGRKVDVCSFQLGPQDVVEIKDKSRQLPVLLQSIEKAQTAPRPAFLEISDTERRFRVLARPTRQDVLLDVNEIMVVEFYSH